MRAALYRLGVRYDAIVVGLGAMGAAALAELSRRGRRVLGLEQFPLPHTRGSSQGGTRIIREAYFEHPLYVPLVQRAYEGWQALERRTGRRLLVPTGGLTLGPPDGRLVAGALASARTHGLAHEILDAAEVTRRHPAVRIPEGAVAVFEPRAGVLLAARCVASLLDAARADGADVRDGAVVEGWEADGDGVHVSVAGETIDANRLVLAAGPWLPALVPALAPLLRVERNVVHWFRPEADTAAGVRAFGPDGLPVLVIEDRPDHLLYALPWMRESGSDVEDGVKFARHHGGVFAPIDAPRAAGGGRRRGDRCRRRALPARIAARADPLGDVPLHQHAGRALPDRSPPRAPRRDPGQPLLRPWLQVRPRRRRNRG